ncbi:MAG: hypothetical protein HYT93_04210 [Parcubacteria group bacterium]|nr:hypothetical protein [Parcubacteria group bacterium]
MHTHIVKRRKGHREPYDNHKVYASCYAACLNAGLSKPESEILCEKVTFAIDAWINGKDIVASEDIFKEVARVMRQHDEKAAFMYETHRDIS